MQLNRLDWSRSRSWSGSFWSQSHNRFLVSISVSHSLVSVLALVSQYFGLINKPGNFDVNKSDHETALSVRISMCYVGKIPNLQAVQRAAHLHCLHLTFTFTFTYLFGIFLTVFFSLFSLHDVANKR